jgi:hypothetical protein
MPSLAELSLAFSQYRRRCGHRPGKIKYPVALKTACCALLRSDRKLHPVDLAKSIGVKDTTLRKWLQTPRLEAEEAPSRFVELKVVPAKPALMITRGEMAITLGPDAGAEEVERLIRVLIAG